MHQLRRDEVDERIHDFLTKKTTRKNLSQTITDWVLDNKSVKQTKKMTRYETLPWATK